MSDTFSQIPRPSPRQLKWHGLEYYGFLHFTVNTFTGREWGLGNEDPRIFNPANFDASQIAQTAAEAGMRGLILTAKHHDGFCLWPSDHTTHSVKSSPWKHGKGDVVAEIASACADNGLLFGVYLSPWDRNHPAYGSPAYLTYYRSQLRELLTRYGPLFEVWFDGANGGDGYYGGKYEQRTIDSRSYYQWAETFALVRELQPDACIFNPPNADICWVGNEDGIAGDPCWHTFSAEEDDMQPEKLNQGLREGSVWFPAECDVSIRPGWFYHHEEDSAVKTPQQLFGLWLQSVGRGANLLLNLPPPPRGLIHEKDIESLQGFRELRKAAFGQPVNNFGCEYLSAGQPTVLPWAANMDPPSWELTMRLSSPQTFSLIELREDIRQGQRIGDFVIEADLSGSWKPILTGQMVGSRWLRICEPVRSDRLRVRILSAKASPILTAFNLFDASAAFG